MRGLQRYPGGIIAVGALTAALGACSSDVGSIGSVNLLPRVEQITRPDWLTFDGGKEDFQLRPIGPTDLVDANGRCAATAQDAAAVNAAAATARQRNLGPGAPRESLPDQEAEMAPLQGGGIALQMTECDVVNRAGAPERLEIGTMEGGARAVTITYIRGQRPGIYRFTNGRLYSIERAPEPPPSARPKGKPAKKKDRA
jgi:hypothetical protein